MFLGLRRICSGDILDLEKFWRYVPRTWKNLLWGNFGLGKIFALVYFALGKILLLVCYVGREAHNGGLCVYVSRDSHNGELCVYVGREAQHRGVCVYVFIEAHNGGLCVYEHRTPSSGVFSKTLVI